MYTSQKGLTFLLLLKIVCLHYSVRVRDIQRPALKTPNGWPISRIFYGINIIKVDYLLTNPPVSI